MMKPLNLIILLGILSCLLLPAGLTAQFGCDNLAYQTVSNGSTTTLYSYNMNTGLRTTVTTLGYVVNAAAYSPLDNYIYASRSGNGNNQISVFGPGGEVELITVPNLEHGNIGAITPDGYMLIANSTPTFNNRYYVVDIDRSRTATFGKLVNPTSGSYPYPAKTAAPYHTTFSGGQLINVSDMVYDPADGLFYGLNNQLMPNQVENDDANRFKIVTLNPRTGALSYSSTRVTGGGIQTEANAYGSIFFDAGGQFYVFANTLGRYFRIDRSSYTATQVGPDVAPNGSNDGASCPNAILHYVNLSGNVFSDANGMNDNIVNGTGTNAGGLHAVLWDVAKGIVLDITPVVANGSYSLAATPNKNYHVIITTQAGVIGSTTQPASVLPAGWAHTGQKLGTGTGLTGTAPGGILPNIAVATVDVTNANFGINQLPESYNASKSINGAPVPNQDVSLSDLVLNGSDPQDQPASTPWSAIAITSLPTNGFVLFYDGVEITAANIGSTGYIINNFDPSKLVLRLVTPTDGVSSTSFTYATIDAAGQQDPSPATVSINYATALPVLFGTINAQFSDGILTVNWEALREAGSSHYDIELSSDGLQFTNIGTASSKAPGGNSDSSIRYTFSRSLTGISLGACLLALLAGSALISRRNQMLTLLLTVGCMAILYSCSKDNEALSTTAQKYFVRIAQVDKDGTTSYSKAVTVSVKR